MAEAMLINDDYKKYKEFCRDNKISIPYISLEEDDAEDEGVLEIDKEIDKESEIIPSDIIKPVSEFPVAGIPINQF